MNQNGCAVLIVRPIAFESNLMPCGIFQVLKNAWEMFLLTRLMCCRLGMGAHRTPYKQCGYKSHDERAHTTSNGKNKC